MSFAACAALITLWRYSFSRLGSGGKGGEGSLGNILRYMYSLVFASIFAGLATAPFIAYHFNNFAPYGVLTNLICVPLTDFIIMPIGIIAILLMPTGLEWIPAFILKYAIKVFIDISHYTAMLPWASMYTPTPPVISWFLLAIGVGALTYTPLFLQQSLNIKTIGSLRKLDLKIELGMVAKIVGISMVVTSITLTFMTNTLSIAIIGDPIFAINNNGQLL